MAKVYVGTYKKYNEGSLFGSWLDLADFETYDDFIKACRELHKDERDPELMIQDTEDFPDGLDCMEWLSRESFDDVKQAMKEETQEADAAPVIRIIDYSEKSFAVVGETKSVKGQLKKMGGRFNGKLTCGAGWIFPNKQREVVEAFISSGDVIQSCNKPATGNKFVEWLDEFIKNGAPDYHKKYAVGAIKMHDRFYLIDKPNIQNKFCFHDEGPQFDLYKDLMSKEERLKQYFLADNLDTFDRLIEHAKKEKVSWYASEQGERLYLRFYSPGDYGWEDPKDVECTADEKKLILEGLQFGRALFEKRLNAYLKRWGVSKLHTWTYWADA